MRRGRATTGFFAATLVAVSGATGAASAEASEYTDGLARKVESNIVYVDPKADSELSTADAGRIRLRIVKEAPGRVKIAVIPESRAARDGGAAGVAQAITREGDFKGATMVVAGDDVRIVTTHPESGDAASAVADAFREHEGDPAKQLLSAVDGLAENDPGPSADLGGPQGAPPGFDNFDEQTDSIFDSVNDAIRTTTLIIAAFFIIPILAGIIWIALRVRRHRKETAGDMDFAQERLRDQLIELGDDIRALDVDISMPGVNALAQTDYEAAVQQYDRANNALQRSEQNPRYVAEAKAALAEGKRRISDAKVRLGITPVP